MKIENDKYYTSPDLAKYVVNKTKEIIGEDNITEYIEPSAGSGVFLDYLDKPYLAYDIEPEDSRVVKQNFLNLNLDYKKGRCIIGNPPYGNRSNLVTSFYKKSIQLGDYIAFILPIGQMNNNIKLYEFNTIHSEDLGIQKYTDRDIRCCFNIYKRPIGELNKKPSYKLKDIEIREDIKSNNPKRNKRVKKEDFDYDIRICFWGEATGKEVEYERQYVHEFCIKVHNDKYKEKVLYLLKHVNWSEIYPNVATPALYQWQVYKYIKEQIPEIE